MLLFHLIISANIVFFILLIKYRAHVTNTQIGKDEYSPFIRLIVRGGSTLSDIPPEIIIRPKNLDIVKGKQSSDLHCFTNARYSKVVYYNYYIIKVVCIFIYLQYPVTLVRWKSLRHQCI